MIPARSDLHDFDEVDETSRGRSNPTLVSLHFVRSALRRRWLVCVLFAVVGLVAAAAFLVTSPQAHIAKTVLVLSHDPEIDPSRAMSTDVSVLGTRTVATKTIASLGLTMAPDEFLKSVRVEPVSSELMSITLTAPTDAEAIRRLATLTTIYLDFRGEQLTLQSNVLVTGMQQRIEKLQGEIAALSRRIEQLAGSSASSDSTLSDTIAQRAYIQGQVDTLRQSVEDATLRNASVVASSRVIDPPATDAGGLKRRIVLTLASGLIGGAALGCGIVLFFAITSDRLRRRSDVAAALEVAVPVSVGRIAPLPQRWLSLPYLRELDGQRTEERHRLAHAIEMELPSPRQSGRLGVVCIDNADEVSFAVATAASNLTADGCSVAVIDLTKQGSLQREVVSSTIGATHRSTVLRPRGIPVLASGMADLGAIGEEDGAIPSLDRIDVTLVLADLDPSVGADYLLAWTDRAFVAVTAGRSSAEMVRTAADLVRNAGLELRLAALLHSERIDESSGTAGFDRPIPVPIHLVAVQDQLKSVGTSVEEKQAVNEEEVQTAAIEEQPPDEHPAEEDLTAEEHTSDKGQAAALAERGSDEQLVEEQAANKLIGEEQTADEEPSVDDEQDQTATIEEQPTEEQSVEEQVASEQISEEQIPDEEQAVSEERTAILEEQPADEENVDEPTVEMSAVADLEHAAVEEEQAWADQVQQQVVVEHQTPDQEQTDRAQTDEEQPAHEEQPADEEQAAVLEEQAADDEQAITDDEQAAVLEEQPADEELAAKEPTDEEASGAEQAPDKEPADVREEQPADKEHADEPTVEMSAAADLEHAAVQEEQASADQKQVIVEHQAPDQEQPEEAQINEEQPADEEQVPEDEHAVVLEEHGADEQPVEEQAAADELIGEEQTPEEQAVDEEQAAVLEEQPTYQEASIDDEPTVLMPVAVELLEEAGAKEPLVDEQAAEEVVVDTEPVSNDLVVNPPEQTKSGRAWQLVFLEHPLVQARPIADDDELDWNWNWLVEPDPQQDFAVIDADEAELLAEPDQVAYPSLEEMGVNDWVLYMDMYPTANVASGPSSNDDELNWDWDWELDDPDSNQDSVVAAEEESQLPTSEASPTTSTNGREHGPALETRAEESMQDGGHRPVENGPGSHGQGRQRTRTRTRRQRSRRK
jgi:hypothetical protein